MTEVVIRAATAADAATIVRLLRALAEYEDLLDQARMDEAAVLRDGFGERRYFECLLAEVAQSTSRYAPSACPRCSAAARRRRPSPSSRYGSQSSTWRKPRRR